MISIPLQFIKSQTKAVAGAFIVIVFLSGISLRYAYRKCNRKQVSQSMLALADHACWTAPSLKLPGVWLIGKLFPNRRQGFRSSLCNYRGNGIRGTHNCEFGQRYPRSSRNGRPDVYDRRPNQLSPRSNFTLQRSTSTSFCNAA